MADVTCHRCGKCCVNNGLIPPYLDGDRTDSGPEWLRVLVDRLRSEFSAVAEQHPCIFLTDGMECAIYPDRPTVCREFRCD